MEKHYTHLAAEERAGIMLMLSEGYSQRHTASVTSPVTLDARRPASAVKSVVMRQRERRSRPLVTMPPMPVAALRHVDSSHDDRAS